MGLSLVAREVAGPAPLPICRQAGKAEPHNCGEGEHKAGASLHLSHLCYLRLSLCIRCRTLCQGSRLAWQQARHKPLSGLKSARVGAAAAVPDKQALVQLKEWDLVAWALAVS